MELLIGPFGVSALIMCVAWATSLIKGQSGSPGRGCSSKAPAWWGVTGELCYI